MKWPFIALTDSRGSRELEAELFYLFEDDGWISGKTFDTREDAVAHAVEKEKIPCEWVGVVPTALGDGICALSGSEFVAQLQTLGESTTFGHWSDGTALEET